MIRNFMADKLIITFDEYTKIVEKLAIQIHNNYQPNIEVDPQTYEVKADGELLTCEPATEVALAQRYFLF